MKTFIFYLLRWQLSSPVLALCLYFMSGLGVVGSTVIANLIGGCVFFIVDRRIFND